LCDIAEHDDQDRRDDLGEGRVDLQAFYKKTKQDIIETQVEQVEHQVTEKLYPAPHIRIAEHHVFHQEKTKGKTKQETQYQGGAMGFKSIKTDVNRFFLEDKFEPDIKDDKTQPCIDRAGSSITKGLDPHQFFERGVKKIDQGQEQVSCVMNMFPHGRAK
jgi:hypothetical protein